MTKTASATLLGSILLGMLFLGFAAFSAPYAAAQGDGGTTPKTQLVPCSGTDCQMCHVVTLIQRIIRFLIIIAVPIAGLLFAWAGVLYFSSAASEENIHKAKDIFTSAFVGFVIALLGYLIVEVIVRTLVNENEIGRWNTIQCVNRTISIPPSGAQSTGGVRTVQTQTQSQTQQTQTPSPQQTQSVSDPQPGPGIGGIVAP